MSPLAVNTGVTEFQKIAEAYFGALADGDLSRVPWAQDVILRAPLAPENPLRGRRAVEDFLRPLAGTLGEIRIREIFTSSGGDAMAVEATAGPLHVIDKFVIRDGRITEQQNFYDPRPVLQATAPGALTADERALVLQRLETSRTRVRELLGSVPVEALTQRPYEGGWTALECAEHLVLAEQSLLRFVREMLDRPADAALSLRLQGRDGAVVTAMGDRSRKLKTFDFLEPKGMYPTTHAVLDAFLARRADTLDFVRCVKDPVHHHAMPLEGLGLLDAYQWLLLIAAHTDRHTEQMREAAG